MTPEEKELLEELFGSEVMVVEEDDTVLPEEDEPYWWELLRGSKR